MRFKIEIEADIDLDGWAQEYGLDGAAQALEMVLGDLRQPAQYLSHPQWEPFTTVTEVKAQAVIFPPARKHESDPTHSRHAIWQTVLQSQLAHPNWSIREHIIYLREQESMGQLVISSRRDESLAALLSRWLVENVQAGRAKLPTLTEPLTALWWWDRPDQADGIDKGAMLTRRVEEL